MTRRTSDEHGEDTLALTLTLDDLAALCAVGAADAAERHALDARLDEPRGDDADDADPIAAFRDMSDAAALLGLALAPCAPPAGALDAIRARIASGEETTAPTEAMPRQEPARVRQADIIDLAERRRRRATAVSLMSVAAAAAMMVLWMGSRSKVSDLDERLRQERETATTVRKELVTLRRESAAIGEQLVVAEAKAAQTTAVIAGPDTPMIKIAIDPSERRWRVLVYNLPALAADQDYQLWFLPTSGAPVPSSVLTLRDDGTLAAEVTVPQSIDTTQLSGAAISREPKGGSPTGAPTVVTMGGPLI